MSDKIIFREKNEKLFWRYWEKLNKQASYRYLSLSLDAYLTISKNRSLLYGDKSFIYYKDDKPLAGVFLPIEKNGKYFAMSIKNNYVNAPLFIDYSVEKEVFNIIDDIAKDNNVSKIMFVVDPLENRAYNYLLYVENIQLRALMPWIQNEISIEVQAKSYRELEDEIPM